MINEDIWNISNSGRNACHHPSGFEMVPTMVYGTLDYWVFGLASCPVF